MKIAQLPTLNDQPDRSAPPDHDREALLRYLKGGRVIRAARSLAPDELDPERTLAVPLTAITDGAWIWSGAVIYYAERYGVPIEPALVEHARRQGYQPGAVSDAARAEAVRVLDGDSSEDRQGSDAR